MDVVALTNTIVPQTCGVGVLGFFRERDFGGGSDLKTLRHQGGAGWVIASFTDDVWRKEEYETAYNTLKKRWKIVYQSTVRKNKRTGRKFFFCIYDTTQKGN